MLHRLAVLDPVIRKAYADYDYRKVVMELGCVHEHRIVGVLLRHPQGYAVLRSGLEPAGGPR